MHRFLWMVLRSVCSPRRKQNVEMQMARQTREITMPTQVMTDSSSSLMRPWYWGTAGGTQCPWPCTRPGSPCAQLGASCGQGLGPRTALAQPPRAPSLLLPANLPAPTPLQAARSLPHALEGVWRDDKRDTNLLLQSALAEGGTMTRENQTCGLMPWARLVAPHAHEVGLPWHCPCRTL